MKLLKNFSNEQLARGGIIVCIASAVVGTAVDIIDRVKHNRRRDKLYATLQLRADEAKGNVLETVRIDEESNEES